MLTVCFMGSYVPALSLASSSGKFLRCLSTDVPSQLVLRRGSPSFEPLLVSAIRNARFVAPATANPTLCIITPTNASHVQAAVRCGRAHGVRLRVRSGGHDCEGLSSRSQHPEVFAVVDLAKLQNVHVDPHGATAWVDSGATIGELYYAVAKAAPGLGFPAGVCPTVGVGGHFSGGDLTIRVNVQQRQANFQSLYLGNCSVVVRTLRQRLPELGVTSADCREMSWVQYVAYIYFGDASNSTPLEALLRNRSMTLGPFVKNKSDYVKTALTRDTWERIFTWPNGAAEGQLVLEPHGGRMGTIADDDTPFPHRAGVLYNIQYVQFWNGTTGVAVGGNTSSTPNWVNGLYDYLEPFVTKNPRAAYANYRDLDIGVNKVVGGVSTYESGEVWGESYFLGNFKRLAMIKRKVDAGDYFRHEQSVPPHPLISN